MGSKFSKKIRRRNVEYYRNFVFESSEEIWRPKLISLYLNTNHAIPSEKVKGFFLYGNHNCLKEKFQALIGNYNMNQVGRDCMIYYTTKTVFKTAKISFQQ